MGFISETLGVIKLDKAAGTLVDISAQIVTATLTVETTAGTFHTLGGTYASAVDGKKTWRVELEMYLSDGGSETEAYDLIMTWITAASPGARTFEGYTPNTSAGSLKFTGEVRVQSGSGMALNAAGNMPQRFRVTLVGDGTLTKSTVSA
jgi:hypothetical protein